MLKVAKISAPVMMNAPQQTALFVQPAAESLLKHGRQIPKTMMDRILAMEHVPGHPRMTYLMFCPTSRDGFEPLLLRMLNSQDPRKVDQALLIMARLVYLKRHLGRLRKSLKPEVVRFIEKRIATQSKERGRSLIEGE